MRLCTAVWIKKLFLWADVGIGPYGFILTRKKEQSYDCSLQSVEKVQLSWAFSVSCDIIFQGDVRCWNAEKWNVESLKS